MAVESSPTVRRRQLAAELRRLRLAAKLTIEQVADQLEWSQGKVSKIENARVSVLPRDVRHLLTAYGVGEGEEREALLALAAQSRKRGWWQQYGEAVPEWFQTYVGLEAEAAAIARYQAEYVPGLLQTRDYAIAVHSAARMNASGQEIEQQVAVRMERQARLTGDGAPQLWVVLNEAVIRRLVGDRATMHEQLVKLSDRIERSQHHPASPAVHRWRASGHGLSLLHADLRPASSRRRGATSSTRPAPCTWRSRTR